MILQAVIWRLQETTRPCGGPHDAMYMAILFHQRLGFATSAVFDEPQVALLISGGTDQTGRP